MIATGQPRLGIRQRDALKYLSGRNPVSIEEMRANGFDKRLIDRLAELGLAYWTYSDGQGCTLTSAGSRAAGEIWDVEP